MDSEDRIIQYNAEEIPLGEVKEFLQDEEVPTNPTEVTVHKVVLVDTADPSTKGTVRILLTKGFLRHTFPPNEKRSWTKAHRMYAEWVENELIKKGSTLQVIMSTIVKDLMRGKKVELACNCQHPQCHGRILKNWLDRAVNHIQELNANEGEKDSGGNKAQEPGDSPGTA